MSVEGRIDGARVIEVIEVQLLTGEGTEENPARHVTEYWTPAGVRLVRRDEWAESRAPKPGFRCTNYDLDGNVISNDSAIADLFRGRQA